MKNQVVVVAAAAVPRSRRLPLLDPNVDILLPLLPLLPPPLLLPAHPNVKRKMVRQWQNMRVNGCLKKEWRIGMV